MREPWTVGGRPVEARCYFCGRWLPVKKARSGAAYFTCPVCGIRLFISTEAGIAILNKAAQTGTDEVRTKEQALQTAGV